MTVLLALVIGLGVLAVIAWWFVAHLIVCWELPVGPWLGRFARLTAVLNALLAIGLVALAIGSFFMRLR